MTLVELVVQLEHCPVWNTVQVTHYFLNNIKFILTSLLAMKIDSNVLLNCNTLSIAFSAFSGLRITPDATEAPERATINTARMNPFSSIVETL